MDHDVARDDDAFDNGVDVGVRAGNNPAGIAGMGRVSKHDSNVFQVCTVDQCVPLFPLSFEDLRSSCSKLLC